MAYWAAVHGSTQLQKLARLPTGFWSASTLVLDCATTMLAGWGATASALTEARAIAEAAQPTRDRRETSKGEL